MASGSADCDDVRSPSHPLLSTLCRTMHRTRHVIALLLVIAQGFIASGLGPRAQCRRPDGSTSVASVLTPCCCETYRGPQCCDDEDEPTGRGEGGPVVLGHCGCMDTPISAQPVIVAHGDGKVGIAQSVHMHAALLPTPTAGPSWVLLPVAGPPCGSYFAYLDSVILRL